MDEGNCSREVVVINNELDASSNNCKEEQQYKKKRKKKEKLIKVEEETILSNFPREIIMDIFSRIPIKSIASCKCVSKLWRNIVTDPLFTRFHLSKSISTIQEGLMLHVLQRLHDNSSNDLCLVEPDENNHFLDNENRVTHFRTQFNTQFEQSNLPLRIVGSCNGLLCFTEPLFYGDPIYICNPMTREYMTLPKAQNASLVISGFGFDLNTNNYKVIRMIYEADVPGAVPFSYKLVGEIYTIGSGKWRSLGDVPYLIQSGESPYLNGNIHWMSRMSSDHIETPLIVAFNISDESFLALQPPSTFTHGQSKFHLKILGNNLCLYDSSSDDSIVIWMMIEYGVKDSWSKRYVIERNEIQRDVSMETIRILENGEILVLWNRSAFFSYDPILKVHKEFRIHGLPRRFEAVPHVASFVSLKEATVEECDEVLQRSDQRSSDSNFESVRIPAHVHQLTQR